MSPSLLPAPHAIAALCCALAVSAPGAVAAEAGKRTFNLPRGDAAVTLKEFAAAAGAPIVYLVDRVRGAPTNAVAGEFTPRDALERMLAGSGLEAAQDAATGAFVVSRKRTASDTPERKGEVGPVSDPQPKPTIMTPSKPRSLLAVVAGWLALTTAPSLDAQTATAASPGEAAIELSPFVINAGEDRGYQAQSSLTGGRLRTNLRDIAAPTSTFTEQFLLDAGITDTDQLKAFMLSTETDFGEEADGQNRLATEGRQVRVRGLPGGTSTVNFFPITQYLGGNDLRLDTFSLERVEQSRGPNAVLFGVATPGGVINVTTKRANLARQGVTLAFKGQSYDGFRSEIDFNQPLLKDRLAVRLAGEKENTGSWRNYTFNDTERLFGTLKWKVGPRTEFNAEIENSEVHRAVRRTFIAFDDYTKWLDTGANLSATADAAKVVKLVATTARITVDTATGLAYNLQNRTQSDTTRVGAEQRTPAWQRFDLVPRETVLPGPGYAQTVQYTRYSGFLTHAIGQNLNFELAGTHNDVNRFSFEDPQASPNNRIAADTNATLPNGAPNPNAGRPYFDSSPDYQATHTISDNARLTASFERDLGRIFGRHTLAGVFQYNHGKNNRLVGSLRAIGNPYSTATPENSANTVFFRTYLGRQLANGSWTLAGVPSDRIVGGDFTKVATDGIAVIGANAAASRTSIGTAIIRTNANGNVIQSQIGDTTIGTLQSRFWGDRIQTVVGFNREKVDFYDSAIGINVNRTSYPGFPATTGLISSLPNRVARRFEADSLSFSGVFHALRWLSLTYNKAENNTAPNAGNRILGRAGPPPHGESQDYGVKLDLLKNRVFVTATYFQTNATPDSDFGGLGVLNADYDPIWQALNTAGVLAAKGLTLDGVLAAGSTNITTFDSQTKGVELELTANLTPSWRTFLNFSKSDTKRTNIGREMQAYLAANRALWLANGSLPITGGTATTIAGQVAANDQEAFEAYVLNDNRLPIGQTDYKLNFRTNYDFASDGRLKGFSVGTAFRYTGKRVLAYTPVATAGGGVTANAVYGEPQEFVDFNVSYRRKFKTFGRSVDWTLQLNVNNVFNNDALVPIRTTSDGVTTNYRFNDPREWSLSSRFKF